MVKCKICIIEFENNYYLSKHIRTHKITSKDYYDKYLKKENEDICLMYGKVNTCKKYTKFISFSLGYHNTCSVSCGNHSSINKRKETCLKKYNVDNVFKNEKIKDKAKITSLNRYGKKYSIQNEEIKNKYKETCLKKYNVDNVSKIKEVKEKIKNTCLEKYGGNSPISSIEVLSKMKTTILNKYGVDNVSKLSEVIEKKKETYLKKYSVTSFSKTKEFTDRIREIRDTYFLDNVNKVLEENNLTLISKYIKSQDSIIVNCKKCNNTFRTSYFNISQGYGKCPICYIRNNNTSLNEKEVFEYIKSLGFSDNNLVENDRSILKNRKELDIYIPSLNIAIEYNGLYWHSELNGCDKNYHLNKTLECESKNIRLIHIFEDEWILKKDIVKSRLRQILKKNNNEKIYARKCIVKEIDYITKKEFLIKYHLQGNDNSIVKLGAFYNNELVSVMTFSHGSISKGSKSIDNIWELNRFCNNYNYHVIGIASKLFSYFTKYFESKEIFSYADRRWSDGNLYYKLGFKLSHITKQNYWYTKDFLHRIHRFNLRKKFNESKDIPEYTLRAQQKYYRVWDCGNYKFEIIKV